MSLLFIWQVYDAADSQRANIDNLPDEFQHLGLADVSRVLEGHVNRRFMTTNHDVAGRVP